MDERTVSDKIADPRTYADMDGYHELFGRLRREDPVRWTEPTECRPFWTISRHADLIEIERRNTQFINAPRTILRTHAEEEMVRRTTGTNQATRTLLHMDDPDHRAFRRLTQAWFSPGRLRDLDESITTLARQFVDRMESLDGSCDFVDDVATWFPMRVISTMLGVPQEDEPLLVRVTQNHLNASDPTVNRGTRIEATAGMREAFAYFTELTAQRRADPRGDVVSLLAQAEIDGEPISDFDRNSYNFLLAIAGHETTSSSISGLLRALIEHPDQLARLRADRSLLDGAITEGLRWTTPVRHFFRTAVEDYRLRDRAIRAGDAVMLCFPSANFDEDAFEAPHEFRIDRSPNRHVAFGYGIHMCLGQHLAKVEMRALFTEILDRVHDLRLDGPPVYVEATAAGGPRSLPITYRSAARV